MKKLILVFLLSVHIFSFAQQAEKDKTLFVDDCSFPFVLK